MSETRYTCTRCNRTDLLITTRLVLRSHTADGAARTDANPVCAGSGSAPGGVAAPVGQDAPAPPQADAQGPSRATADPVTDFLMGPDTKAGDFLMGDDPKPDGTDKLYKGGRYALPDPLTGAARTWTRATTMAETVSDLYSLNLWRIRMTMIGAARFPEVLEPLRAVEQDGELSPKTHRDLINSAAFKAQELAGSKVPARWGTELHLNIERLSRGEITLDQVPDGYRDEASAWSAAMQEADLSAVPHLVERRVAVPFYGVAGTLDQVDRVHRGRSVRLGSRVVRLETGDMIIGDVKSGRDLSYGWGEIAIQMSLYAHGLKEGKAARWDPDAEDGDGAWTWEGIGVPVQSVRTDIGVVMHTPIGESRCTLYWIDLDEGWKAVQLCEAVRDWRRTKGLHMPFSIAEVATQAPPVVREPTWEERFGAVTTREQARAVYRRWLDSGHQPTSPETARLVTLSKRKLSEVTEPTA